MSESTPTPTANGNSAPPRLIDVAHQAGVSPATVSRVLNHSGPVNTATRERVRAAMAALGYVQTPAPPSATPSNRTIAVFITDILNPVFPEFLRGIEDEIGTQPIAMQVHNVAENSPAEKQPHAVLTKHQVDGVIAIASHLAAADLIALHEQLALPVVVVNRRLNHPSLPCIVVDFEDAAYRSALYLTGLGHRRIGFLAGFGSAYTSQNRKRGIERALAEVDATLPAKWHLNCFPSIEGGFQAMSLLLALPTAERPSAIIAFNDVVAFGALHALRAHGLRVPEDMSVIGCDGIALAAHSNPPLTTIDQPKYRMGRLAMQTLHKLLEGDTSVGGGFMLMESPLITRESTAPYAPTPVT
ncbi:MAG: LacI family DNA-binding transcriptional regulator [Caldilineaceae bacterium]